MVLDSARSLRHLLTVGVLFVLTACGGLEYGGSQGPGLANSPGGSNAFINATAVKVGKGDTVYSIARRHKLSPRDIIIANDLRPPYKLFIGQRLELPHGRIHTVRSGEYLSLIADRYRADTFAIARLNGIRSPYTIYPGQKLRIPRSGQSFVASAPPRTSSSTSSPKDVTPTRKPPTASKREVSPPPPRSGGKFSWPLRGTILSNYGSKEKGLQNDGINIAAPRGTPVKASENGVVAYAGNEIRGFGNLLLIKHDGGWMSAYAHNEELLVKRGDKVQRGQLIAKVGSSGSVATPQLHFELRKGSRAVDPRKYMM